MLGRLICPEGRVSSLNKSNLLTNHDNPAHHALHKFDHSTRNLYTPRPNGRGGMTHPPTLPIGLKVESAIATAEIDPDLVCPLVIPDVPPGSHVFDPRKENLIDGTGKDMIEPNRAQADFHEYRDKL